jgi:hypothetical protein
MPEHGSSTPDSAPEDLYKLALEVQQTLKRLLAEITQLLETTRELLITNPPELQSSPDEAGA